MRLPLLWTPIGRRFSVASIMGRGRGVSVYVQLTGPCRAFTPTDRLRRRSRPSLHRVRVPAAQGIKEASYTGLVQLNLDNMKSITSTTVRTYIPAPRELRDIGNQNRNHTLYRSGVTIQKQIGIIHTRKKVAPGSLVSTAKKHLNSEFSQLCRRDHPNGRTPASRGSTPAPARRCCS